MEAVSLNSFFPNCLKNCSNFFSSQLGARHQNNVSKRANKNNHHKFSLKKLLVLTSFFIKKSDTATAIRETSGPEFENKTSTETVVDLYSYCREVCVESLFNRENPKNIGEPPKKPHCTDRRGKIRETQIQ